MLQPRVVPVGKRILVCWSGNVCEENVRHMRGLDPKYFEWVSGVTRDAPVSTKTQERYRGAHLRMIRHQASEMLFALLAAYIQAPTGVVLWLSRYQNVELRDIIQAVNTSTKITSVRGQVVTNWTRLAEILSPEVPSRESDDDAPRAGVVASLLQRLAVDALSSNAAAEYNAMKHGFRGRLSGVSLQIRPSPSSTSRNENVNPLVLNGSEYGLWLPLTQREGKSQNYTMASLVRHWDPDDDAKTIVVLSRLSQVVVALLLAANGDGEVTSNATRWLDDVDFGQACRQTVSLQDVKFSPGSFGDDVPTWAERQFRDKLESFSDVYLRPMSPLTQTSSRIHPAAPHC